MFRLLTAFTVVATTSSTRVAGSSSTTCSTINNERRFFSTLLAARKARGGSSVAININSSVIGRMIGVGSSETTTTTTNADTTKVLTKTTLNSNLVTASTVISIRGGSSSSSSSSSTTTEYETLSTPSPGSPFHYAFPVHDLDAAKEFYGNVLGCQEGRSSEKWQDYSLHGHQIVCHWVGNDYRCQDYYNPVDGDEVPVPHAGLALTVEQFHDLVQRLKDSGQIEFIIEPHLRFEGQPGEQYTMFFKDPSGNNLEFKAMTKPQNLFAKYNVVDH